MTFYMIGYLLVKDTWMNSSLWNNCQDKYVASVAVAPTSYSNAWIAS